MKVRNELEYTKSTASESPLDEAMELMKAVVDLQAELLEAFYSLKEPQIKEKKDEVPKIRAPSIFTALVTPFSVIKAREYFHRLSVTPFRTLAWKTFLFGVVFSTITVIGHRWLPLEFGTILIVLGNEIINLLPVKQFPGSSMFKGLLGLSIGSLLLIIQSLFIGLIVGVMLKNKELPAVQGSKITLTADFVHLVLLGLLSIPVLQLKSMIFNFSTLLLPILLLFVIIFPLIMKFVIIWRGIETMYGETGFRGIISVLFIFFLNLIYYALILG